MIQIRFYKNTDGNLCGFDTQGHADYAKYGQDIICAAVSVLVLNTINSIDTFAEDSFQADNDETTGRIQFWLNDKPSRDAILLLKSLRMGLIGIQEEYGKKYILITTKIKEV